VDADAGSAAVSEDAVGEAVSDDGFEGWTADYDMDEFEEADVEKWGDLPDFGFSGGVHQSMEVGALPEWDGETNHGLVFMNRYGGPGEEKVDTGLRQQTAATVSQALGGNVPDHTGDPAADGYVAVEGVEGSDIGAASTEYWEKVDEEEFYRQAGVQVLVNNSDAHMDNVLVTPDGDVVFHDVDHAAGDLGSLWTGEKGYYDDNLDRTLGELWRSAQYVVDDDETAAKEKMFEAARNIAQEAVEDYEPEEGNALYEALQRASDMGGDHDYSSNVWKNIQKVAKGEITW
jgi:hypothetical protein